MRSNPEKEIPSSTALMKRNCIPFIVALLAAPAQAAPTAYDGFDYTPDEVVVGKNGGSGFSGAWVNKGTNGTGYVVKTDGLAFSDLSVTGGRVQVQSNGGWAASSRIGRDLSASASGQTYGSFLGRRENDNSPNTVAGLLIGAPAMADNDHTAQFYPDHRSCSQRHSDLYRRYARQRRSLLQNRHARALISRIRAQRFAGDDHVQGDTSLVLPASGSGSSPACGR